MGCARRIRHDEFGLLCCLVLKIGNVFHLHSVLFRVGTCSGTPVLGFSLHLRPSRPRLYSDGLPVLACFFLHGLNVLNPQHKPQTLSLQYHLGARHWPLPRPLRPRGPATRGGLASCARLDAIELPSREHPRVPDRCDFSKHVFESGYSFSAIHHSPILLRSCVYMVRACLRDECVCACVYCAAVCSI
jgi:hypothetical protein